MRISCEVSVGARRHSGLVLNVSPSGLFVQTVARPTSGDTVQVALNVPGRAEFMTLDATVVWKRAVPAGLLRVAQGGVGLCLVNPPEGYYQFLADAARSPEPSRVPVSAPPVPANSTSTQEPARSETAVALASAPNAAAEACETNGQSTAYKVHVSLGQRSRIVAVSAPSETRACEIALERAGAGWKIIGFERGRSSPT
jgi:Tfp pilus assembly protein PilZ